MLTSARIGGLIRKVLICGVLLCVPLAVVAARHQPVKATPAGLPQQQAIVQQPEIQQPAPTPEEMPATPPKVSLSGGRLSIVAENSTLGDVLNAVKKLTGATLELPGSAASERIAVNLGPGEPQQVLQQLFVGSRFDYIILGSPTNAAGVEKIILTARGAAGSSAANQPPRNANQPPPPADDNSSADDEASQQPEPPPQPEEAQPQQIGPGGEAAAQENQQNQPKSPEQLLQQLQQMQQQQQQQGHPPRQAPPQ